MWFGNFSQYSMLLCVCSLPLLTLPFFPAFCLSHLQTLSCLAIGQSASLNQSQRHKFTKCKGTFYSLSKNVFPVQILYSPHFPTCTPDCSEYKISSFKQIQLMLSLLNHDFLLRPPMAHPRSQSIREAGELQLQPVALFSDLHSLGETQLQLAGL